MLVTGRAPFQEQNDSETLTMILDCRYYLPGHLSPACANLISRMLVRQPLARITLDEIIAHEWLQQQQSSTPPKVTNNNNNNKNQKKASRSESNCSGSSSQSGSSTCCCSCTQDMSCSECCSSSSSSSGSESQTTCSEQQQYSDDLEEEEDDDDDETREFMAPMVKREHLSEQDNEQILNAMLEGKVATTRDEIIK